MTDWAVQSVIFLPKNYPKLSENYPKLSENCPKMSRDYPNTALKLLPNPPKKKSNK